jgi:hypothetical protein
VYLLRTCGTHIEFISECGKSVALILTLLTLLVFHDTATVRDILIISIIINICASLMKAWTRRPANGRSTERTSTQT